MGCVLDRKEKFCLKDTVYLAASLWRDAVWPALPLYLPEAKVRIAARVSTPAPPSPPVDLIGSGRSRTDEQ